MTRNIAIAAAFTFLTAALLAGIFLREKPRLEEATGAITAERLERGARDYEQYCATCHGLAGQGYVQYSAPRLNNIAARKEADGSMDGEFGITNKYGTLRNYIESVLVSGVRGAPMPAFGAQDILRDDQIENITSYVLSWSSPVTDTQAGYQGLPTGVAMRADQEATDNAPTPDPNANPVDAGELVFQANCSGCHQMNSQKAIGPGLGGLFQPEGTVAFGTVLPNNQPVSEENVRAWILGGTAGFPENIPATDGDHYPTGMPGIALTDEQMANVIVWLRVHDRDGNETAEADQIRQSGNTQTESPAQPGDNLPMTPIPTGEAQPNTGPETQQQRPTSQVNEGDDAESAETTAEAVDTPTP